jgi:hypothetical protein
VIPWHDLTQFFGSLFVLGLTILSIVGICAAIRYGERHKP